MPRDGTPFLIADYSPTSWHYVVKCVMPPPYKKGDQEFLDKYLERATRYAHAWMPMPRPPGPHGTGWTEEDE